MLLASCHGPGNGPRAPAARPQNLLPTRHSIHPIPIPSHPSTKRTSRMRKPRRWSPRVEVGDGDAAVAAAPTVRPLKAALLAAVSRERRRRAGGQAAVVAHPPHPLTPARRPLAARPARRAKAPARPAAAGGVEGIGGACLCVWKGENLMRRTRLWPRRPLNRRHYFLSGAGPAPTRPTHPPPPTPMAEDDAAVIGLIPVKGLALILDQAATAVAREFGEREWGRLGAAHFRQGQPASRGPARNAVFTAELPSRAVGILAGVGGRAVRGLYHAVQRPFSRNAAAKRAPHYLSLPAPFTPRKEAAVRRPASTPRAHTHTHCSGTPSLPRSLSLSPYSF